MEAVKTEELVCDVCGKRSCFMGELLCDDYKTAGACLPSEFDPAPNPLEEQEET